MTVSLKIGSSPLLYTQISLKVRNASYGQTACRTSHLTSFGAGFYTAPNKIDFEFIFAKTSFEENVTIYLLIIISLLAFLLLTIWGMYVLKARMAFTA